MTLSIIIPTHRRFFQVQRLLSSVLEQDFPRSDLQVLLVSNLQDRKLTEMVSYWEEKFFDFRYMETGLKGVNKARNLGVRFARGDILYFLDDDCVLDKKDHLKSLISAHRSPAIGIGGGYKTSEVAFGKEEFYQDNTEQWIKRSSSPMGQSEQLIGGNSSYKREVFDRGFYFDSTIVFGGSELGFNKSLRLQGWNLSYEDRLSVLHKLSLSWNSFIRKSFKQGLGSVKSDTRPSSDSLKEEWAFFYKKAFSSYSLVYNMFFKLGFFWGLAGLKQGRVSARFIRFIFFIYKKPLVFFKRVLYKMVIRSCIFRVVGFY